MSGLPRFIGVAWASRLSAAFGAIAIGGIQMNPARICLLIFCLISSMVLSAIAQDKDKPGNKPETTSSPAEAERPKSEVQLMLDAAKKRGEPIMGACLEKCGDDLRGKSAEGVETGHALELPQPAYPPLAARAHVSGEVLVQVIVGLDGKVM